MSKYFKVRALVIRSRPLGEADRLLNLFTFERGKLSAVAPGARKIKSRLAAGVELFNCGNFLLYKGRTLATITQSEIETSFRNIRDNIRNYAFGMYFNELVEKLSLEGETNVPLFRLLSETWQYLDQGKADRDLLARCFELKMLSLLGYKPHFRDCLQCGNPLPPFFWDNAAGGIVCSRCFPAESSALTFSGGTRALTNSLINCSPARLVNLRAQENQKKELKNILQQFLQYWTGIKNLQTLQFLEKIEDAMGTVPGASSSTR
jgi:DNA repair protein RecO (recombination protein O)